MNVTDKPDNTLADFRDMILLDSLPRLQHIAWRTIHIYDFSNLEFVVACIQVDSHWRELAESFMPGHDWQAIRDNGVEPFIEGTATRKLCDAIVESFPNLSKVVYELPEKNTVKAFILTVAGCAVYDIEPKPQQ